ncbi:hypothetical protein Drorol1_Dr00011925 [Drosera rotundifolia]
MATGVELVSSNVGSIFGSAFQNSSLQISNVKLDGPTNYVVWSRQCFMYIAAGRLEGYLNGTKKKPAETDASYSQWFAENSLVRSWLLGSMDTSLVSSYICCDSAAALWDSLKQVFSQTDNYAQVFELHQQVHALHQRELNVVNYAKTLTSLWQRLDYFDPFNASCVADGTTFCLRMDRERMYRFLAGLNEEYDGLRSQLLSRSPPPTLNEACAAVQHEELRQQAMRRPVQVENAATSETQSVVQPARILCEHCKKIGHTKDRCWELVGRPSVGKNKSKGKAKQTSSQAFTSREKVQAFSCLIDKLTPQNFEKLFEQVKAVNIDNALTLGGVISQIFDKALMEPTFCEMYADFCYHLASELPDLSVGDEKITFKRLLLNKCQEEFERGEREEEEANKADNEGESKLSDAEREEKRLKSRRRMLGNIRLIGELFKKSMLTERVMHECIKKLLGQYQTPDEDDIEALCVLMSTIGEMIDYPKAKEHMDAYFDIMAKLSNNMKLSSRVRFMLKDAIDLRKNKWQQRRKVEGPKKIEEVHRDAIQERQTQTRRLSRGPSISSSMRRGQPVDLSPRGSSVLPSPVCQGSSFRGLPNQARGYSVQDPRFEERNVFESRTLSVPLSQRQFGGDESDDSITLGPQGGLARGMSTRGQPLLAGTRTVVGPGEGRRVMGGLNGYSSTSARATGNSVEEVPSRYPHKRFGGPSVSDHSSNPDNVGLSNRDQRNLDRNFDRIPPALSSLPSQPPVQREQRLRDMSMATIIEFYSAEDEKEVALCIKDMNAPSFYSSLISIWVTNSFERNDMERDLLAKLLVNLTKPHEGMFKPVHLTEGFESVLANLEDTVNDAPRAAEFLGRLFGRVIVENVVSLGELGRLIYEGGEEPGRLREVGLAGDVLGSILETIKSDQGESVLNDILGSSNLRLEDFRPPGSLKSRKLEMFI